MTIPAGPKKVWIGLNTSKHVDAAMVFTDNKTYIFQENLVYRWVLGKNNLYLPKGKVEDGWPKNITEVFPGVPNNLDTAFQWYHDKRVYFFKGSFYYIWNQSIGKVDGPFSIEHWRNICNVYMCSNKRKCLEW